MNYDLTDKISKYKRIYEIIKLYYCENVLFSFFYLQQKKEKSTKKERKKKAHNNRFNLTCPLSRFVQVWFEFKKLGSGSTNRANPLRGTGGAG